MGLKCNENTHNFFHIGIATICTYLPENALVVCLA